MSQNPESRSQETEDGRRKDRTPHLNPLRPGHDVVTFAPTAHTRRVSAASAALAPKTRLPLWMGSVGVRRGEEMNPHPDPLP